MATVRPLNRVDSFMTRTLEAVRELILEGHFAPGERVNEVELSRSLGVSRGPLREALQQLSSEGLVLRIQHRGTFIPDFGAKETTELFEVREALEVRAAELAAERAGAEAIDGLRSILDEARRCMASGTEPHYPLEPDFHAGVVALTGNQSLVQHSREVQRLLHIARMRSGYEPERARTAHEEHQSVLDAIADHDADRAGAAMRHHLRKGFEHVAQIYRLGQA